MSDRQPSPERLARRRARRDALHRLADAVRELIDATVSSDVEPAEVDAVRNDVLALTRRLNVKRHPGIYSGLLGREPIDHTRPRRSVPLSPWMGPFNPLAPPIEIEFRDGGVFGSTNLGKAYIGPPNAAHGGVVAGILDQLLASAGQSAGVAGVTANMSVRFRKPTPLYAKLTLRAWADPRDEGSRKRTVHAEIRHGNVVTAEGRALVIRPAALTRPDES